MTHATNDADTPMPGEDPGALIEDEPGNRDPVIDPDSESDPQPGISADADPAVEETERRTT